MVTLSVEPRTGRRVTLLIFLRSLEDFLDHSDIYRSARKSHDSVLNDFGSGLLEMCACFDLCLVNGFVDRDLEGNFTYVSDHGSSVVDCFAVPN